MEKEGFSTCTAKKKRKTEQGKGGTKRGGNAIAKVFWKCFLTSPEYSSSTCNWLGDKTPISSAK